MSILPEWLGGTIAFVYGAVVGSFLNVCIYRLPAEQSIVKPPSHCPRCNKRLRGIDLVPLLSFLFLGRKCRYCAAPISWRYFTVELITGLLFLGTYLRYGFEIDFFFFALFISAMLVAFFVDIDQMIIPDQVVIFGLLLGVGRDIAHLVAGDAKLVHIPLSSDMSLPILPSMVGMAVCAGLFYLVAYISYFIFKPNPDSYADGEDTLRLGVGDEHEPVILGTEYGGALGGGDVNLAAAIGAVLGVMSALASFFVAVMLGGVVGVVLIAMRMRSEKNGIPWRTEIPFGPYMVTGAVCMILFDRQLAMLWEAWSRLVVPG